MTDILWTDYAGGEWAYQIFEYTGGNQTWTRPGGVTFIDEIILVGGGSGGEAGANVSEGGTGGSGGWVSIRKNVPVESNLTIYVGGGGAGGTGSIGTNGTDGEDTTVTGTGVSIEAQGGAFGFAQSAADGSFAGASGGAGGIRGQAGYAGPGLAAGGAPGPGSSYGGGGGGGSWDKGADGGEGDNSPVVADDGVDAVGCGGGGGGGGVNGSGGYGDGGAGAPGICIIKWRQ